MSNIRQLLVEAVGHHGAGQLQRAADGYRQVLKVDPRNADAWHLLGVIAAQVGNHPVAVEYIQHAIVLNPSAAAFHSNLGAAHQKLKQLDEAAACYRRALQLDPRNAEALNNLGVTLMDKGQWVDAADAFEQAIALKPGFVEAHSNLGNVLQKQGKAAEAMACHQRAIQLKPDYADAHDGLGAALRVLGRLDEAVACCQRSLQIHEKSPKTYNNLGVALRDKKDFDAAIAAYRRAIALQPDFAEAHTNLGNALRERGQIDEAIFCHRRALELRPDFAEALNNLGNALEEQAKVAESLACYREALAINPELPEAHHSLGTALTDQGQLDAAIVSYRRAIELKPDFADAHNSLGIGLEKQGRLAEAVACYQRALALKPDMPEAHSNIGNFLKDQARLDEAIVAYRRAIELDPNFADAHNNLGNALKDQGKLDEAMASYRRALELKPDFADAHSNLIFAMHYRPGTTAAELKAAHAEFGRRHASKWQPHDNDRDPTRCLRLGFVSPDFCQHPVGYFLIRGLENLDRQQAEIFCYNDRLPKDSMTARFQAASSHWRDVFGQSDDQLAAQIRDDRIDILFDLAGHTARNRILMFTRKPAPLQISWIGYEGTTGIAAIDYLLADRYMVPDGAESNYCESVLRLPDCYLSYDPSTEAPQVAALPALTSGRVTFGSFNNLAKVSPAVVAIWAKILRQVGGSRLMLKYRGMEDASLSRRYRELFAAEGIAPEQLILEGWSPLGEMLAAHGRIDIALDPFPFAGGVTTCNALWMGVPVVTWPGETFASRHALSYLSNVGFTETVAENADEYVAIAVRLAGNLSHLAEIRSMLRATVAASPLCNGRRFAESFMQLLRETWQRHNLAAAR